MGSPGLAEREDEMIDWIIYKAFDIHCNTNHLAEYEVCDNLFCRFAYWVERVFRPEYGDPDSPMNRM